MTTTIGSDVQRFGARGKVTGSTRFGADHAPPGLAYAMVVTSTVGKGRVKRIDTSAAERTTGVLLALTHETMDRLQPPGFFFVHGDGTGFQSIAVMQDDRIFYRGQPIALIVAESLEAANEAAALVQAEYEEEPFSVTLDAPGVETVRQAQAIPMFADPKAGNADEAMDDPSLVTVDFEFTGPPNHHNPIELLATVAEWEDGMLTVHESTQGAEGIRFGLSHQLGIDPANVRVISPYAGGAFGQKIATGSHTVFAAVAARRLNRPVKIVLPRKQTFYDAPFRPATKQRVKLAADSTGRMVAAIHEMWQQTSKWDLFPVFGSETTSRFYNIQNFRGTNYLVQTDAQTTGFMRAPYEHIGSFALESAVDELSYKLGIDPIALRLMNDTQTDPMTGKPFSSRHVKECLTRGASLFGWEKRNPAPRSMRAPNGDLLGWGVAIGAYAASVSPAAARVSFNRDGTVAVRVSGHEMGQGLRSAVALVAAEKLGVDPAAIQITCGDTSAPPQHITAGSWGTASACSMIDDACNKLREKIVALNGGERSTIDALSMKTLLERCELDFIEADAQSVAGALTQQAFDRASQGRLIFAGPDFGDFVTFSFVAQFIEVAIDPDTFQVRVPRAVSVVDCGKVVSLRTARSQAFGGLVWGLSACLREATDVDTRFGGFLNTNIAEYHIPVNADIGEFTVDFINEPDLKFNSVGAKGMGEVAMCGVAAAIANAIYHATGRRFRSIPIRLDDLNT